MAGVRADDAVDGCMRHAARVDANKTAVVSALEAAGARVWDLKLPLDLLVGVGGHGGIPGRWMLMEVKDGNKPPSARKKTALQERFFAWATGLPIALVDGPEAALRALAVLCADMDDGR